MMKLRVWSAFLVFMSGYAPLGLMLTVLDFDYAGFNILNPETIRFSHPVLLLCIMIFFGICCWFTRWQFRCYKDGDVMEVIECEDVSPELLNYAVPYIAGFAAIDVGSIPQLLVLIIILGLIFMVTYKAHSPVVNPFVLLLGYRMKKARLRYVGGEEVNLTVLTKKQLEIGIKYRFKKLSEYCTLETEQKTGKKNAREEGEGTRQASE